MGRSSEAICAGLVNYKMPNLWNPDLYHKAWDYATRAHQGQLYGATNTDIATPYIFHIGSVAMEVAHALIMSPNVYNSDLAIQCALLHDTIEDTHISFNDIVNNFGLPVANGVSALTKDKSIHPKSGQMVDSIKRIKQQPQEIWMVKLADRTANLNRKHSKWSDERMQEYCLESRYIYRELFLSCEVLADRLGGRIDRYGEVQSEVII